jgi:dipeptidase E
MKQIIAMGGGGFSMEDNPALDRYIVEKTGVDDPAVCFVPTATGDSENYILRFYNAFLRLECRPTYLSLFKPPTGDLEDFLLSHDVIYVGGGNTRSMLALWREWGLDAMLRKAWENDVILAGISAGAICWFAQGLSDSIPGKYIALPCLGFLAGSCSPHFDGEVERRPTYHRLLNAGEILPGYAIDDSAALHFLDDQLAGVVASRPNARAYRLWKENGDVKEEPLETVYLEE